MDKPKIILGIETSCDETAAAVGQLEKGRVKILSNVVATSLEIQAKYGGIVPEQAAREQLKSIIPVIKEAIIQSQVPSSKLDAIAVTQGPGLIGSLLVGVETAKVLAIVWNKPLIPINHLIGHFYANWISLTSLRGVRRPADDEAISDRESDCFANARNDNISLPQFPCIGLLVSGGHTDLILMKDHGKYEYIGGTRDDAAGECFDKCARLLGLPYPGGPVISKLAKLGNPEAFKLPRPMLDSGDFDFSFSGLKTAAANLTSSEGWRARGTPTECPQGSRACRGRPRTSSGGEARQDPELANMCASIEAAIVDVLVQKTIAAAQRYKVEQIIVAGGVAANQRLAENLARACKNLSLKLFIPPPSLCTDNAAMITAAAFFNFHPTDPLTIQANPNLSLQY